MWGYPYRNKHRHMYVPNTLDILICISYVWSPDGVVIMFDEGEQKAESTHPMTSILAPIYVHDSVRSCAGFAAVTRCSNGAEKKSKRPPD